MGKNKKKKQQAKFVKEKQASGGYVFKPNPTPKAKSSDREDRTIITIETNKTYSDNIKKNNEGNQASNDNLDFTKDPTVDKNQEIQNKNMQSQPSNSGNQTAENQGKKSVVEGVASKIMFVKQDSKTAVKLSPTPQQKVWAKTMEPIIATQQSAPKLDSLMSLHVAKPFLSTAQALAQVPINNASTSIDIQKQKMTLWYENNYPKGIPRSFYVNQTADTPEPYSQLQQSVTNWQPVNTQADTGPVWQLNVPTSQADSGPVWQTNQPTSDQPTDQQYPQAYSPSDIYTDNLTTTIEDDPNEDVLELESEELGAGQKRQSAFDRLGPVSQQPKKPKLTINLLFNKEQAIREVVDDTPKEPERVEYIPVHLRPEILESTDPTVQKYIKFWPWKKPVDRLKTVTVRNSKSVMLLEKEQMDDMYEKNHLFFTISVKGYPPTWTKENVIDTLLDFFPKLIPLFIEHTPQECQFFVLRSRPTLLAIHKAGFIVRKEGVELTLTIGSTSYTLNHIAFIPKLVLRNILSLLYDGKNVMNLSNFTTKEDLSHIIYFPLNRPTNQITIAQQIQTTFEWDNITELNLSHNRITSIEDFNLVETTPKLKHLDLSHNNIDKVMALISIRDLGLHSIVLEGNPLCNDYVDSEYYIKVLKTMFSSLKEIDGVPIHISGEMPTFKKHYCPEEAKPIIDKLLEVYFPLLEALEEERVGIDELYHEEASLTVTYRFKLRYSNVYRYFRSMFHRARMIDEGEDDSIEGALEIAEHIEKWPPILFDPSTFTIDVLHHDEYSTVFKVAGMLKLTDDSLAEEEHLIAFTKTFVLQSYDGYKYKITNEMVYWDVPTTDYAASAFQTSRTLKHKKLSLQFESAPEDDLKEGLLKIFMQLTNLDKNASERCLEQKNWNLKMALDYFMKLLKLDELETLTKEIKT